MLKTILVVELIDGRKIENDISELSKKLPPGAPATHEAYVQQCVQLLVGGLITKESPTEMEITAVKSAKVIIGAKMEKS